MFRPVFRSNQMKFVQIALALASLSPLATYAALGSAPGVQTHAVAAPRSLLQPTVPVGGTAVTAASVTPYTVREASGADGVTIREYVLPTNVVFAVTWQGPVRPDMNALLGSYFSHFTNTGDGRTRGTGPLIEHSADFHIESAGRAGYFFGKAYLSRLVPANVIVSDLQ
jgi:Protein of unknown function (DUF2844)